MKCHSCNKEDDVKNHLIVGPEGKSVKIPLCQEHRNQVDGAVVLCATEGRTSKKQQEMYDRQFGSLLEVIEDIFK